LAVGDTNNDLASGHTLDLGDSVSEVGYVFQHLGAEDAIEAPIGKVETGHIAFDRTNSWYRQLGLG
jgi:hypothetical protein